MTADGSSGGGVVLPGEVPAAGDDGTAGALAELLCEVAAAVCDVAVCGPQDSLLALGLDSLRAAEAAAVVEDALSLPVPAGALLAGTPAGTAGVLLARWRADGVTPAAVRARIAAVIARDPEQARSDEAIA